MAKSVYIVVMLLLGVSLWDLIPLAPVINPVTVPVLLALWAVFGLVHYRNQPHLYQLFEYSRYRRYYLWFFTGIALSVLPAYFFWSQDLLSSLIVNRGLIIYAFIPVLMVVKPTDRELIRGVIYYTVVYMLVWTVQALLMPIPITVPFLDRMMMGAPFEIDPGDFGKLLPGYTVMLLVLYLQFQRYYLLPTIRSLLPALLMFVIIFLLQNRGTLFFASGVLLFIFVTMKSAYKPYQLLGFGLLGLAILYLTAGSWIGLIEETRAQAGDMDYDRWKALSFFIFDFPPNALTYILGNGRFSFHSDAGANTVALSMAGFDQSDIGLIGFWSIYGVLPVGVIVLMMTRLLTQPVYPFYLKALALHVLLIPIAWNFVSYDAGTLVLVFYLFAYYAEAARVKAAEEVSVSSGFSTSGPAETSAIPGSSATSTSSLSSGSVEPAETSSSGGNPSLLPRLVYVSPDCFFDTDYLVLGHLAKHYRLTWVALVTVQGNRVASSEALHDFAREQGIELRVRELNWRKTSLKQLRFARALLGEISRIPHDLLYIEDLGDTYFYALQPLYLSRKSTVYALHDVVPHSSGSGAGALATHLQFRLTRWLLLRWARQYHIFSRTEYEKFRLLHPRTTAFYTRLMLRSFGPSAATPPPVDQECRLLFFGVIAYYKGLDLLIDAVEQLAAEGITNLRLTIAGKGPHWDECAKRIKTPELYRLEVRYIADEELPDLMAGHHFMVLPYRDASQSGPQTIALNYHLPVIVSDVEGLSDFVENGRTGWVFRRERAGISLEEVLRTAARMSDDEYRRMRGELTRWTEEKYSEEETIGRYVKFFNQLI